ncbi:hypothetical protein ZYGM_001783 [Zygosaccharomyces mellis]|uniref:Uncharacterized protein n=1 Tax=Zygosaccharomyces mellis TaxID=42258 RepID=A0A4C2E9L1_9SACH|nr:hypothetical protein ZYGM_001783 [Zygosaccharomyces mellis]
MSATINEKKRTKQKCPRSDVSFNVCTPEFSTRHREGPTDEFYKSLAIDTVQSRENVSSQHRKQGNLGYLPVVTFKASRNSTFGILKDEEIQHTDKNPMAYFERGLNYTVRPKSPKASAVNLKCNDEENYESEKNPKGLICNEITEAFEDDMFSGRPISDNRWNSGNEYQSSHQTSSVQLESSRHLISRGSSPLTLPESQTVDVVENAGFRFQLKQDTGKLRAEALAKGTTKTANNNDSKTFIDSSPPGEELSTNYYGSVANDGDKYWKTNRGMQSKRISEKISRELQTVRRFAINSNGSKNKPLSSRVKRVCSEDRFQNIRSEVLIQGKFSKAPASVKEVNSIASIPIDAGLSDFMSSVRKIHNGYYEVALKSLEDKVVRDTLLAAKERSDKIWSQDEKLEFLV